MRFSSGEVITELAKNGNTEEALHINYLKIRMTNRNSTRVAYHQVRLEAMRQLRLPLSDVPALFQDRIGFRLRRISGSSLRLEKAVSSPSPYMVVLHIRARKFYRDSPPAVVSIRLGVVAESIEMSQIVPD